jgi:hypothetical protein
LVGQGISAARLQTGSVVQTELVEIVVSDGR